MADYVRGIATGSFDGYGLIQSIEYAGEADEDTAKDKDGDTAYHDVFDARVNVSATIRFDRTATLPVCGDVLAISAADNYNGSYKILAPPSVAESNTTGPVLAMSLRRYIDGGLPVAES